MIASALILALLAPAPARAGESRSRRYTNSGAAAPQSPERMGDPSAQGAAGTVSVDAPAAAPQAAAPARPRRYSRRLRTDAAATPASSRGFKNETRSMSPAPKEAKP